MTDPFSNERAARTRAIVAWLLVGAAVSGTIDLVTDSPGLWRGSHAYVELSFIVFVAVAAVLLLRGWLSTERSLAGVRAALATRKAERDRWQAVAQNALRGLGEAMDRQFDDWALTPAEKETAMFLLKGYSHKETAGLTKRSERTVRQHAVSVYRKSGLSGRAELAAFFFEDMLLPSGGGEAPGAGPASRES
ncbi:MAG: response regulator transcription factor [Candidatus Eisenbacteria bacterium]|nr:response regulator transcription factor [Candidatus Eisenbacteria bacterium]